MISWAVPCAKKGDLCHPTRQAAACRNFMQISGVIAAFSSTILSLRHIVLVVLRNKGVKIKAGLKMNSRFKELLGWIFFFFCSVPSLSFPSHRKLLWGAHSSFFPLCVTAKAWLQPCRQLGQRSVWESDSGFWFVRVSFFRVIGRRWPQEVVFQSFSNGGVCARVCSA